MKQDVGKCTNFSSCKLAYRNEQIRSVTKGFRCPECGSPLEPLGRKKQAYYLLYAFAGVGAVLLVAIGAIFWTFKRQQSLGKVVDASSAVSAEPFLSPTADRDSGPFAVADRDPRPFSFAVANCDP